MKRDREEMRRRDREETERRGEHRPANYQERGERRDGMPPPCPPPVSRCRSQSRSAPANINQQRKQALPPTDIIQGFRVYFK
jgi:hypothetical protein